MPHEWTLHHRCSLCLQTLRSKSSPIPLDPREEGEVRRLGPKAASQAQAALKKMNAERALANQPALRLDDPAVFAGRLHYQEGKQCYTVVFRELKELKELKSASAPAAAGPSAGAGLADQRASQPRRAPKQTALQRLIADAGELTVDALLDGGTISVPALRRRTGRTPPTPDADRNEPPADAEMADAHDAQGEGRQPTAATSEAAPKSARAIQMAATHACCRKARNGSPAEVMRPARALGCVELPPRKLPDSHTPPPPQHHHHHQEGEE